ncbi:MAG: SpoIIE family protein phosphatase [Deltaproteobacteria bacterium]|nr:SpoIIE family protein phosphatase [Deltaproteobacteria bacterium]
MKILFLHMRPSRMLTNALVSNGFSVETASSLPRQKLNEPDLIAFAPRKSSELKLLKHISECFPRSFVALAISVKWIKQPKVLSVLLNRTDVHDLWLLENWEHTLWFSLQKMFQHRNLTIELEHAKEQCQTLKSQVDELSSQSKLLVEHLERDIELAANVQRALLPKVSPEIPGVSLTVKYLPSTGAGGDYYDIFEFGDKKRFGILIADSKTHGLAASLLSVLIKVRLEEMKERFPDSKTFVDFLNHELQKVYEKNMASLSLLYGIIDRTSLTFQYTIAGDFKPILWRLGESAPLAICANPPLGGVDHYPFRENYLTLKPGDLLILHTDGLIKPLSEPNSTAHDKIVQILKSTEPAPDPLNLQNELLALVEKYTDQTNLEDDLTLIQLYIHERTLYLAQQA